MNGTQARAPERVGEAIEVGVVLRDHESVVSVSGSGPETLLLTHAIGTDRQLWRWVTAWMPADVRCIAVDLHGFGSASATPPTSLANHADDLVSILDQLGIEQAHVAGHSYGGAVAATFALGHQERLASLGLIATVVSAPRALFTERARLAEAGGAGSFVEPTLARWFTEDELRHPGRPVHDVAEVLRRTPLASWVAGWRILAGHDISARLGEIMVPTTVVAGEVDVACPADHLECAARQLPNARFTVLRGGAHVLPLEKPFELAQLLYSSIRGIRGERS